ncbi:alpha-1A adrenergic receptor-like [Montipora capricornis]|uniref:alpha-1A adrenergic receptor-like n=1 Tax=Montipora capricornis TaxID=246305 RepID=UPI0035F193A2
MNASNSSSQNIGNTGAVFSLGNIIAQASFIIFILILDVCGNCLVIGAILSYRRLRTTTNYFIISLAVSDLLIAALSMPFRIHHTLNSLYWNLGIKVCEFWVFIDLLCSCASITNLSLISIDRFLALTFPLNYRSIMTKKRGMAAIAFVWAYSGLIASLSFTKWTENAQTIAAGQCLKSDKYYYLFSITAGFLLPLTILVINYSLVFRLAFKQAKKLESIKSTAMELSEATENNSQLDSRPSVASVGRIERKKRRSIIRELKATKTLAVVIGTFIICWLPFFIIMLTIQFYPVHLWDMHPSTQKFIATVFAYVLPLLNSAVNPIIYSSFNSDFRFAFKDIFLRIFIRRQQRYAQRSSSGGEDLITVVTFAQDNCSNGKTPHIDIQESSSDEDVKSI